MPSYETPEPITAILEFDVGDVRVRASERPDTVVTVVPSNSGEEADVRAAQQTKVSYAHGTLTLKGPKQRSLFGKHGSIDVTVELPAGSHLRSTSPMADHVCEGTLGECRIKTSFGSIRVDETDVAHLRTEHGDIHLGRARGETEIAGSGRVHVTEIVGGATVKNNNGETTIGSITGDLKANNSNGHITVGVAHGSVEARTANGSVRLHDVARGVIQIQTAAGDLEVGIRETSAAWLDVHSKAGGVRNTLSASDGPGGAKETVEIHARTSVGTVIVRRA
ncbi:DUF4097 family beta strand repeat-containing protein [Streptomyces sp. WAC06614]|uniref:DUF4097 family beta strand repeat-containing protein n=1 Tax=Streptomyces sp. WAC06614 TaxID=2487416 RepID=UPI000F7888F4|nr:DUF4097 family beta strand repeat-containing protein [Streptomyces sp. WAC06614]RSS66139.1 hypothetical protein EF918_29715 [Streptomyces sp. WAC06614]